MKKKTVSVLIIFSCCLMLLAKEDEFVKVNLKQYDSIINESKKDDFNSSVFNHDSIAKYNYDGNIMPLRSYLYPNNTGLTDNELFNKYKLYQQYLKKENKIKTKKKPYEIAMVAEFRRVLGENPFYYVGSGKYYLEYEITEVLFDAYGIYKLGDKIKVYQGVFMEMDNMCTPFAKYVFLSMRDKFIYDYHRFDNEELPKAEIPILIDIYSTNFYIKLQDSIDVVDLHTIKELREIYKDVKQVKKEKSEPLYWYDYDFESLLEKKDKNEYIKDSK